jgi:hypothetical protein
MNETRNYWTLVEPMFEKISIDNAAEFARTTALQPRPVVIVFAAHFSLSEINNGGLLQLFYNSTGVLVPEAIEGFEAMKMTELSSLLQDAAELLGQTFPRDREKRWDALLSIADTTAAEQKAIMRTNKDFTMATYQAMRTKAFDSFNEQVWELAATERGGFDQAADHYLRSLKFL